MRKRDIWLNHFQVAREITIHSTLDHKNIIQLWAAFEDQYGIYLVFEYASKGDVFMEVERRGGQLNEAETVISPFLSALDYLHSNYIIHRDIKPENLLFTATGVLKICVVGIGGRGEAKGLKSRVASVAAGGRFLGHSNSMSAVDGMRYRDIHLDSVTGGMASAAVAALSAVKRLSDGDGTTGGRPSAAGGRVSRAGTARNSGAGGLSRMNSMSAAAAAAAVAAEDSPKSGRPMTREELLASLTSSSGSRSPLMRSFTAGRASPSAQPPLALQHSLNRKSGCGGGGGAGGAGAGQGAYGGTQSPGRPSPLAHHSGAAAPPPGAGGASGSSGSDVAPDFSRLRVDAGPGAAAPSGGSFSSSGAPPSPKLATTPIRPSPPQAPSPTARGLKSGSPLIPSRLSQSFTSPVSPLASASGVPHQLPSRLGLPSNSGAVGQGVSQGGGVGGAARPQQPSGAPPNVEVPLLSAAMLAASAAAMSSPRVASGSPSPRELPGDRDPELEDDSSSWSSGGTKSPAPGKGLFGSFKKVFS
ncbi:putative spindle assembly checkpoint kinase [Tetrabaena socialis]|uniref:Putative spindle assembly checkpoint kinase n=1 Tax=Tetrabaena socialis TaxID=47790 RepID=A0A2J8AJR8_9CHLO|nr:putative spindle assembly checkpoint kinase [Tetrabaena socialis]|eukprot:PNH12764.1 putative spindle assembly checkpoint kinase [Tetrabaena socialis]